MKETGDTMKKPLKIALISFCSFLGVILLVVGSYVGYVAISYNRIEDNQELDILHQAKETTIHIEDEKVYTITSYNIGFGAYSQDYTFFLDEGMELDGTKTVGYYSKARSKEEVLFNTNGAIATIVAAKPDFAFFQEVDTCSTRSYKVNQNQMIQEKFNTYDLTHAVNFHSAYLAYPFYDMHGKSNAGITTISKFFIQSAVRKSFTVSTSFSKFFDLDRCFSVQLIQTSNDKFLHLINVHMSAYDEGGKIRKKQREELNTYLKEAMEKEDYVIVGGDFNHDLLTNNPNFSYDGMNQIAFSTYIGQQKPEWLQYFYSTEDLNPLPNGYRVVACDNAPTCRDSDVIWEKGHTYVSTIDGFIVSNNIQVLSQETIVTKDGKLHVDHFAYSDHDPVMMKFKLMA